MDIRFTVNETKYRLSSDKYQVFTEEVRTSQSGKNKGEDMFVNRKNFKNTFQALSFIADTEIYNCECETFKELAVYHKATLDRLNTIADEYSLK